MRTTARTTSTRATRASAGLSVLVLGLLIALAGCATGTDGDVGGSDDGAGSGDGSGSDDGGGSGDDGGSADAATDLTIVVDEVGDGAATTTYTLTCDPAGGDHPDAEAACAAIADAGGAAAFAPPPKDQMCTEQYGGPQTAMVQGTVDGQPVTARFSRTNGCEISRWDALVDVFGTSGGV